MHRKIIFFSPTTSVSASSGKLTADDEGKVAKKRTPISECDTCDEMFPFLQAEGQLFG